MDGYGVWLSLSGVLAIFCTPTVPLTKRVVPKVRFEVFLALVDLEAATLTGSPAPQGSPDILMFSKSPWLRFRNSR